MNKMKAYVRTEATSQEVKLTEVSIPDIRPDDVLVKVEAFGVGIHDRYFIPQNAKFPYIIGTEGAGVITELGNQVNGFSLGDRVLFTTISQPQGGSWAEYAVATQQSLIPLPDDLSFAKSATVPIAGEAALQCMRVLNLDEDDSLFIAGASGAIGTFIIQLAAAKGIHVSASASEKNHSYMVSLGAEKVVDYNDPEWQNKIKAWSNDGVTAALAIQPGTGTDSIKVVKDGGLLVTVSGDSHTVTPERNITVQQMDHDSNTQQKVVELINDITRGNIQIFIEKEYTFEQAQEALKKTETRHARGKLIVIGLH